MLTFIRRVSVGFILSWVKLNSMIEVIELLKEIKEKLEEIDEKIDNFMGFFELDEDELKEIRRDIEAYERGELEGIDLEKAKRLLNVQDQNPQKSF